MNQLKEDREQDDDSGTDEGVVLVAETLRAACIQAALQGYEDAKISGLCHEGAWEAAIGAMRVLDLNELLESERPV